MVAASTATPASGKRAAPAKAEAGKQKAPRRAPRGKPAEPAAGDPVQEEIVEVAAAQEVGNARSSVPTITVDSEAVTEKAAPDDFSQECASILELLDRATDLTEATRGMLRVAAPYSLRTPKGDRHDFQQQMAASLAAIFKEVEASSRAAADAAVAEADGLAAKKGEAADEQTSAATKAAQCAQQRDQKNVEVKESSANAATAKEALLAERQRQDELQAEHIQITADKVEQEKLLAETWAPLKAGVSGKQWRERNKFMETVMKALQRAGLEESLKNSLPVVLKLRPEERGPFAAKAVDFSEELLRERVAAIAQRLASFETELAERAAAVSKAHEALSSAEAIREERMSELVRAEDDVFEAKNLHVAATRALEAFGPKEKELEQVVTKCKDEHAHIVRLLERFETVCEEGAEFIAKERAKAMQDAFNDDLFPKFAGEECPARPILAA